MSESYTKTIDLEYVTYSEAQRALRELGDDRAEKALAELVRAWNDGERVEEVP